MAAWSRPQKGNERFHFGLCGGSYNIHASALPCLKKIPIPAISQCHRRFFNFSKRFASSSSSLIFFLAADTPGPPLAAPFARLPESLVRSFEVASDNEGRSLFSRLSGELEPSLRAPSFTGGTLNDSSSAAVFVSDPSTLFSSLTPPLGPSLPPASSSSSSPLASLVAPSSVGPSGCQFTP